MLIALAAAPLAPGEQRWLPMGSGQTLQNPGTEPGEFLRFDLKTPPVK